MDALKNVQAQIAQQNASVGAAPVTDEVVEGAKKEVQAALDKKLPNGKGDKIKVAKGTILKQTGKDADPATEEAPAQAEDKKAGRKIKLDALGKLAAETQRAFVSSQEARASRSKADGEVKAAREEAERARKELEQATKDPLAWLESKGVKARTIAERIAKGESPDDALKALTQKILDLESQREKDKHELEEREKKLQFETQAQASKRELLSVYEAGKAKFPTLHRVIDGADDLVQEFMILYRSIKSNPELAPYADSYTNEEMLEALEAKHAKRYGKSQGEIPGAQATPTTPKPTLTSRGASETGTVPKDLKKLPHKQQIQILTDLYKAHKSA